MSKLLTRDDHAYQARVWMQKSLADTLESEALARIEALLPGGYRYRIEKGPWHRPDGQLIAGWHASFGDTADGSGYGVPHSFRTRVGATLGLLAILSDGCVFPGCATSYGHLKAIEKIKNQPEDV